MTMATEDKFPTVRDLRDALSRLCDLGLGEMPTQVTIVPASTMIAVARALDHEAVVTAGKPPLMIEFGSKSDGLGAVLVSVDYLLGKATTPMTTQ
jgi:hypothetical protein